MTLPPSPLLVTLQMDGAAFAAFNELRGQFFPAALNRVPAHLSLFHHLPGEEQDSVAETLRRVCTPQPLMRLRVAGVQKLGRGVAYRIDSPELLALHRELARSWAEWLTPQDQQRFQPHIVVQNKVVPEEARALHDRLQATFTPWFISGTGMHLWWYRGGPWELVRTFSFAQAESPA